MTDIIITIAQCWMIIGFLVLNTTLIACTILGEDIEIPGVPGWFIITVSVLLWPRQFYFLLKELGT